MTTTESRKKWALLLVAGLLAAGSGLFIRLASPRPSADRAPESAAINDTATPSISTGLRSRSVRQRDAAIAAQNLEPQPSRPAPPGPIHPAMQSALDQDPDMAQYHWLSQKVLPTEEHRRMRLDMLADLELIQKARTDLLASGEGAFSRDGEAERMLDVEFLADAIAWADNPEIETVSEAIEDVLFAENITQDLPDDLAQSLAGDKMELYTQVLHASPDRAAIIAERASGRPVEALLRYSKDWYEGEMRAMRADERP